MVKKKKKNQLNQESRDGTAVKGLAFNQSGLGWILDSVFWKSSNIGNISFHLVMQHCYSASCKAWLPIITTPQATCYVTNFSVASCSNIVHKVELSLRGWSYRQQSNLQSNNVAQQVARKCCPYYLTLSGLSLLLVLALLQGFFFAFYSFCTLKKAKFRNSSCNWS